MLCIIMILCLRAQEELSDGAACSVRFEVMQEAVPLMMRSSSGLHSHSIRLAKQDSINSLQTKLRQQFRQRMPSAFDCHMLTNIEQVICCCC